MRKIKFRVWNSIDKVMVYNPTHLIFGDNWGDIQYHTEVYLDHDRGYHAFTLQQYTGVNDKNDKEIYEGDIVHFYRGVRFDGEPPEHPNLGVVEYNDYISNGFIIHKKSSYSKHADSFESMFKQGYLLVIGNIYENPELIPNI